MISCDLRQLKNRRSPSATFNESQPISIIHGDADPIVPLFQAQSFKKIAQSKGVPIEMVIKEGAKHGWPNKEADEVQFLNWFDRHLLK